MSVTRVPSLLEQSIKTKAAGLDDEVRTQLGCASAADVNAALVPLTATTATLSAQNITQTANIAAISASLANYTPLTVTNSMSANFVTDINNLDLSLTQSIVTAQASITATDAVVADLRVDVDSISGSMVTIQGTIAGNLMKFVGWTSAPTSAPITADLWASVNITGSLYKFPVWIA